MTYFTTSLKVNPRTFKWEILLGRPLSAKQIHNHVSNQTNKSLKFDKSVSKLTATWNCFRPHFHSGVTKQRPHGPDYGLKGRGPTFGATVLGPEGCGSHFWDSFSKQCSPACGGLRVSTRFLCTDVFGRFKLSLFSNNSGAKTLRYSRKFI